MKKYILFFIVLLGSHQVSTAQKKQNPLSAVKRCYTMERVQRYLQYHPEAKILAKLAELNKTVPGNHTNNQRPENVEDIINVPVVFHIVLANPYLITDAVVQSQIDELNTDFSGLNADSTNAVNFYSVRGHSLRIRFVLAKRTPAGFLSNGIDRIKSSTGSDVNLAVDPIKRASMGGADAWDPASYINFWIGRDVSGKSILGYAQFPGTGIAADDGVFCSYQSFGVSNCNMPSYNRGRTLCHEVGHYFGLYHIWGDDDGCAGDDFRSLSDAGSTVVLPAGLFNADGNGNTAADIGDTPNQGANTTACLSGIVTDGCATVAPGKMYQNYMDYTADACYSLFTKKQVERMEWILDNFRTSLETSLGGVPPSNTTLLDASPYEAVNPGGAESIGCTSFSYPSVLACPGAIMPKIRIRNNGTNALTSVTVGLLVNGVAQTPVNVSIAPPGLAFGATTVVNFSSVSATTGVYTLQFYTYNVNGTPIDLVPANDTLTTTLTVSDGIGLPAFEGFQNFPFPANNWSLFNPDGDATWAIANTGSNSTTAATIDNFSKNNIGLIDQLRTPKFLVSPADSVIITFDLAHKNYPGANDQLSVLVSNDCGANWTSVYAKSGDSLATAGSTTLAYTTPGTDDWRNQRITIGGALLSTGQILIAFQNKGDYGNNIFIDNIAIYQQAARDLSLVNIVSPNNLECSSFIAAPQVTISNNGQQAITSFKVGYILNNATPLFKNFIQTIVPGTTKTVALDSFTAVAGLNTFKVFLADPASASGTGDQNLQNDTASKTFKVNKIIEAPVTEGFENTIFPPQNWEIISTNSASTWQRKSPGNSSGFSAFIDNFTADFTGETSVLKSPAINVSGTDSVFISFDLAHKNYPGSNDKLKVKVSTDCGNTFSTVFDKSGSGLATAGASSEDYIKPVARDWKRQRIALDSTYASGGSIIVEFENTSDYGNNIFIDNINITKRLDRDLKLAAIVQPAIANCSTGAIAPVVVVTNVGVDTITAFKITYVVDNENPSTKIVTDVTLAANQQINLTLSAFNYAVGSHLIKVFVFEPATAQGTGDLNTVNDTLIVPFVVLGTQPTFPLKEGFEGTSLPPVNWGILNPDSTTTWVRSTAASNTGFASMVMNNFSDTVDNSVGKLVSPVITNSGSNDSIFVAFDLAYQQGITNPGSPLSPSDTLEVQVTKDCGATYQTVWQKWGANLQTTNDPNSSGPTSFVPVKSDWKNINCYLTPFVGKNDFQVQIVAKGNKQNNIWIDNINIYAKILPPLLKQQGYLIYPNPFNNKFLIHHFGVPVNLKGVQIYNSMGQRVWDRSYSGNAQTEITVDLSDKASGVYILKLFYVSKTIEVKIVKQ